MKRSIFPDVSVIIPAYNAGKYVQEAIYSALQQTLLPSEIVVVDDGSMDDTREQVANIESPLVKYVWQPNRGVSAARNNGIERTTGELIAFLDADDRWRPEMLETHAGLHVQEPKLVFTFSDFERFDHTSRRTLGTQFRFYNELSEVDVEPLVNDGSLIKTDAFCTLVAFGDFPAFTQAMMFKRSLLGDLHFDTEMKVCEDAHFVLRACTLGEVGFSRRVLADVRRHNSNVTADHSTISIDKLSALLRLQSFVKETHHRLALDSRASRAHFDVARLFARTGNWQATWRHWKFAVARRAPLVRKLRSTAGLLRVCLQS